MPNNHKDSASPFAAKNNSYGLDKAKYLQMLSEIFVYKSIALKMFAKGVNPTSRVLDVGCGSGLDLKRLSEMVPKGKVVGVDYDEELLKQARASVKLSNLINVELLHGDLHKLEFPNNYFDGVRADRVFQHVENPKEGIVELYRVLSPGGILVTSDPLWRTWDIQPSSDTAKKVISYKQNNNIINPNFPDELLDLFKQLGLKDIKTISTKEIIKNFEVFKDFFYIDKLLQVMKKEGLVSIYKGSQWLHELSESSSNNNFISTYVIRTVRGVKV